MTAMTAGRTGLALAFVAVAMATIALIDNGVRFITPEMGLWQFQTIRAAICCAGLLALALMLRLPLGVRRPGLVALRSAVASLAVVLYFGALAVMTMNQAGAGLFSAPVFVLLFSVALLGLRVGPLRTGAVVMGFVGVLVVLRPWGDGGGAPAPWAAGLAVAAGALHGTGALLTRQFCAEEPTAGLTLWHFVAMGLWGILGMATLALLAPAAPDGAAGWFLRGWTLPSPAALGWTAVNALGSLLAMALLIRAYQIAEASRVAVFEYLFLPFAALWTWLLFGETADIPTVLGTVLIVVAGALILRRSAPARAAAPAAPAAPGTPAP